MIVCAGNNESFSFAVPIGIGLVNASISLTKLFIKQPPKKILFIGSAGSYGNLKEFDIVMSKSAANIEIGFLEQMSYSPILEKIKSIDTNVPRETLPSMTVNSSNFITSSKMQSKLFLSYGLELENMEFFAVLKAAKEFNISSAGLFCISNMCCKNAHKDFIKNSSKVKNILENEVLLHFREYI